MSLVLLLDMERKDPLHDVDDHCFHPLSQSGMGQPSQHLRVCEKNPEEASTNLCRRTARPLSHCLLHAFD